MMIKSTLKIASFVAIVGLAAYSGYAIGDAPGSPVGLLKCLWLLVTKGW